MELSQLAAKAKKGDDNAFAKLIEKKKDNLYRIAYSYVKNQEDALDIVSETVFKAYTNIGTLKNPDYFYTWLTRITINTSIDHIKKHSKTIPMELGTEQRDIELIQTDQEATIDLYNSIDKLDEKLKTVIILKYLEDMTLSEVAETMEMPLGTVKTFLNKALKELRLTLKEVL